MESAMSSIKCFFAVVALFLVFATTANGQSLDLSTGQVNITDKDEITLEHLLFDNVFYNATIQLNLDGTYQVNQVETLSLTPTAVYQVTFTSTWSQQTHPHEYPTGLSHFSGLIGATHNALANFWQSGEIATSGIESMAETGSKSLLITEINAQIDIGNAQHLLSGGGIGSSPGEVQLTFEITQQHPFVTLVSMIAPSPDWFVGVSSLPLITNGQWVEQLVVPLFAYDAGTDSGAIYTSPNSDTQPRANIQRIETLLFLVNSEIPDIGTFTFDRIE
jgi:spondin N